MQILCVESFIAEPLVRLKALAIGASLISDGNASSTQGAKGIAIAKVFMEQGRSGIDRNRPALLKMLQYCTEHREVKAVIVADLDRLLRRVADCLAVSEELKKDGVVVHSVAGEPAADPIVLMTAILLKTKPRKQPKA